MIWCICSISCLVFYFLTVKSVFECEKKLEMIIFCRLYLKCPYVLDFETTRRRRRMEFYEKWTKWMMVSDAFLMLNPHCTNRDIWEESSNAFSGCHIYEDHIKKKILLSHVSVFFPFIRLFILWILLEDLPSNLFSFTHFEQFDLLKIFLSFFFHF